VLKLKITVREILSGDHSTTLFNRNRRKFSPKLKRLEREAEHLPPFNSKVKNTRRFTCTPTYVYISWWLSTEKNIYIYIFFFLLSYCMTEMKESCF
jgi:hypothetical protein